MYTHIAYLSTEQKARPVGVRIVEPPPDTRQAVRGHLYAVVEYAGDEPATAQLVERALSVIQRTYYTIKGTQTFVLTEALREGMAQFPTTTEAPNASSPPGLLLMALLGNNLTAVGAGPAVALLTSGSNVDVYPPYVTGADAARKGWETQSALELYRQTIPNGGTVLLAGQRCLQHFTLRELASIVAYVTEENVADVAMALRNQAGADALTGLIAVMAPGEEEPAPLSSPKTVRTPLQRTRRISLPGALSGQRGAHGAVVEHGQPTAQEPLPEGAAEEALDRRAERGVSGQAPQDRAHSSPTNGAVEAAAASLSTGAVVEMAQRTVDRARTFFAGFLPGQMRSQPAVDTEDDRTDELATASSTPSTPSTHRPTGYVASHPAAPALGTVGYAQASDRLSAEPEFRSRSREAAPPERADYRQPDPDAPGHDALDDIADDIDYEDAYEPAVASPDADDREWLDTAPVRLGVPKPAMGRRARLFALVALSILLLTVVTVATVFWTAGRSNVAAADELLARAESSYLSAQQALNVEDKVTARLNLMNAQAFIAEANSVMGTRMERADQLSATVEQQLADLLQVQPLHALAAPLVRFPESAQPQRVVVSDQDIYVLDTSSARQSVQYFELDPTRNIVTNLEGETILSQGEVIDGVTVGRLIDITWLPAIAGVDDKAYLLALDSELNLFRYDRRVEGVSHITLGGRDLLRSPAQMRVYSDRLYVADTGANQIYRYGRGNFEDAPEAWFGEEPPSIGSLRSMAIDGSIWFLLNEGLLLRFNAGTQAQFSLESGFGQIDGPVDLAVGNESTSSIYVADSAAERILVFDKSGKYLRQLQAPEGDALRNLRGIFVDEVGGVIYILTQSSLYQHPLIN